ncbi:hypothetical protein [Paracoccus sp. SM22M-07]|uniref:hypothetical protein n=1 Tax=Paracoccus sp. SM22M-07 TaxID=1520813 RepID=UPI0009200334|nr:hypothetical protein [Paracoccus sp. SM22M-07]OJH45878.1 hypothetical protein IE00_01150 [Paracoccus sp. SM22M-07]
MTTVPRSIHLTVMAAFGAVALAGCEPLAATPDGRPKAKPAQMVAQVAAPGQKAGDATLTRARISTKSGEILILEEDGSVTTMDLDSPEGQDAFTISEADLAALNANLDLDFGGLVAASLPKEKTAQEKALEAFAARSEPALPTLREDLVVDPAQFIAAKVEPMNRGRATDLVEVTANLRQGVDADIAFSYATCALAGWAKENGTPYGRHIRTLQAERNGKLLIGSAFILSQDKPLGLRVMETEETLRECRARGIPAA